MLWGDGLTSSYVRAQVVSNQTVNNTPVPSVIHVAIRANNNPRGQILWVQTLSFKEYCTDVLPNEWGPAWKTESLKAGAMAVKMFGWYHTLHPVTIGGFTFDVDNTTNFQEYKYMTSRSKTDQAIQSIWPYAYTYTIGEIAPLDYRAGNPNRANSSFDSSQKMSQWGSQYWAIKGMNYVQILGIYYSGRTLLKSF